MFDVSISIGKDCPVQFSATNRMNTAQLVFGLLSDVRGDVTIEFQLAERWGVVEYYPRLFTKASLVGWINDWLDETG